VTSPPEPEESERGDLLDLALLRGFEFDCRPDCGLCCFAAPRVTPREQDRILRIVPEAVIEGDGRDRFLAARGDGGACQFLRDRRCSIHALRPVPCREFPVTVHVGERLQATLVLGCPGLDLNGLQLRRRGAPAGPVGLDGEIASAESRIGSESARRQAEAARRRRRIIRELDHDGLWMSEEEVRRQLRPDIPLPHDDDFPVEEPPAQEDGVAHLPLFFDERPGPVALAQGLGGWELLELAASGGHRSLGILPPPGRPPPVDEAGAERLCDYLAYWLERDALFGAVLLEVLEDGGPDVLTAVGQNLRAIGAQVLARAEVRAKLRGEGSGPLGVAEIDLGIAAVDADLLDRPTWGDRL
jgi:Fe-S-cluster containining protein